MEVEAQPNRKDNQPTNVNNVITSLKPGPIVDVGKTKDNQSSNVNFTRVRMVRLSKWFVKHQKNDGWGQKSVNALHVGIVGLLVAAYICHIMGGPIFQSYRNNTVRIIIEVIESSALFLAFVCLLKMWQVNGSWAAAKMLRVGSARIYVYGFWLLRSTVVEILKGQPIYAFLLSFHTIMIYSTDTWHLCNQKVLATNVAILLLMITYEFFLSISPLAVDSDVWVFWNVEVTANSLSRSNYFNFFMIFFDAFIMILYDSGRSKFVMVVKKQKRKLITLSESKQKALHFAWIGMAFFSICLILSWIVSRYEGVFGVSNDVIQISAATLAVCTICNIAVLFLYSTNTETRKNVLHKLLRERRVIFIFMLLGVLFYIHGIYMAKRFSIFPYIFALAVITYIFSDFISASFPRNGMLILLIGMLLLLSYQIILYLFLLKDCKDYMFDWGILGKKISYCTVGRLTCQSIFSLLVPAALQTILRRSHNMNFCNANVYRSSGTVNRHRVNHDYVDKMKAERLESRKKKVRKKHEIQMV